MCHSGRQCQFSSKSFAFTLDQLLYADFASIRKGKTSALLLVFSLLCSLLAIPNNIFSYVTFRQRACLRNGVGHYLLCLCFVNQINLTLFLIRLIYLIASMIDPTVPTGIDEILCRSLSYLLTCSGRLVYWLSSWIAIERVYTTLLIHGRWLKKPRTARALILVSILVVLIIGSYELVFYKSFYDPDDDRGSICVFEYPVRSRSLWSTVHLVVTLVNSLIPFLINLFATLIIMVVAVRKKMKTLRKHKGEYISGRKTQSVPLFVC